MGSAHGARERQEVHESFVGKTRCKVITWKCTDGKWDVRV